MKDKSKVHEFRLGCIAPIGVAAFVFVMFLLGLAFKADGCTIGALDSVSIRRLFNAIAQVESDRGKTSGNVYQLTPEYVADVNRIQRKEARVSKSGNLESWHCEDAMNIEKSEEMMCVFWAYYARRLPKGGTAEELAKIHHVGYRGLRTKRTAAEVYWRKVRKVLKTIR